MGRPKKKDTLHSTGRHVVKIKIGVSLDGTPIRKAFYSTKSKADAQRKADEYRQQQKIRDITGQPIDTNIGFTDYAIRYLALMQNQVKENTFNLKYKNTFDKHLFPYFKNYPIQSIKKNDIELYLHTKEDEGLSGETLKVHLQRLHGLFENALENDIVFKNPCNNIKIKKTKTAIKNVYTEEQVKLVIDYALNHRFGLEIILLLEYGLRRSELLGIKWEDVDFDNDVLHIRQGVTDVKDIATGKMKVVVGELKTEYSKRDLPLYSYIRNILNETEKKSEFVFCNKNGNVCSPRTWSRRHFDVFMEEMHNYYSQQKIDIPILNPHELRHTRATLWVNKGLNLYSIADIMGWADLKMLRQRYAHRDTESNRKQLRIE